MGPTAEQVCRELECCSRNGSTAALHDAHKCKVTCVCAVFLLHACAGGRMCLFQLEQSSKACTTASYAQRAQNAGRWVKQHHQNPAHSLCMSFLIWLPLSLWLPVIQCQSFSWHLQVFMTLGGRSKSLVYCYTAVEAAHAHDVAKLCLKGPYQCGADDLNFPASDYKTDDLFAEAAKLGFLKTPRPTQKHKRPQYVSFLCDSRWLTNPPNPSHTTNEVGCGVPSRKRVADTTRAHTGSTGLQGSHKCCMSP